ncbi:MAG: hypothetical protein NT166_14585 [Candidatus Aminicenantes bacterium]|nr:hypothetical protein [Candidatus Aminicenantes bacterium]
MSEKVGVAVKKTESKGKDSTAAITKSNPSQTVDMNSPVEQILHLQRTIGNQAVSRMIRSGIIPGKNRESLPGIGSTVADLVQRTDGGGGAAPCTPRPVATRHAFNNANGSQTSPNNCCPNCPRNLGVTPNNRVYNGMEMEIEITNHCPGSWYDVLRTREGATYEEVQIGGIWQWRRLEHQPMGTWDDRSNNDECLTLQNGRYIYVEDVPGWHALSLPLPDGTTFTGDSSTSHPDARQFVSKDRFAEWVNFKHRDHNIGWTTISSPTFFHWHSTLWLEKVGGQWRLNAANSEIDRGPQTIGATP